jgi:zinc transporter ZupT
MLLNILILLVVSFFSGLGVFVLKEFNQQRFKIILAFSGAYLFSLTVIHILPEAVHESTDFRLTGIFVLAGFFLQMVLEFLTAGVEHGHLHAHDGHHHHHDSIPYSILIGMGLHGFLEGMLLYHPSHAHAAHDSGNLLFGLILHKIPEAFALMSVLVYGLGRKKIALVLLFLFSMASPLGLLSSSMFFNAENIPDEYFVFVFALIAGNFLYISTTIFFEASPNHKFKGNRLLVCVLGALSAVVAEFLL